MDGIYTSKYGDVYVVRYIAIVDEYYLRKIGSTVGTFISESDLQAQVRSEWLKRTGDDR
jgi:hypothetical protein